MFGVPPGFHGEPCAGFSRCGKIFSTSLKIISEKYFSRHIGAGEAALLAAMCARIGSRKKKSGWENTGLVAEAHFAEGWLEGDQSFILRTGPGRSPLARGVTHMGSASLRYCLSSAARQRSRRDLSRLFVVGCRAMPLAGALSCPGRGRRKILHSHGLPALWSNAPDCCERLARPCTGKPPSTFALFCPGPLGQTGLSPESCTVAPPRFGPRQAGRWRCPGQQEDTRCRLEFMISCLSPAHDNLYEQTL